ncbi:hypothetical protein [Mesorhizobium sp. M8A.F.Ca.ET.165.01.1.1]|uniref:hypothetical protein n=1 Tax=Mesorhizobium sp. M8A.F.Ca.ET.165.01.1.1 TaxID=2563960 RepID=UPI0010936241|nr:hypothetical protein [Mesorhizobium sp. M8A.F.Ca.ET.165.01.1.1]TGT42790.1 hypothetical protein EN808_12980 [Mesorhizobium sp. M8A.F.Ca.ET.165.01.1.1]
MNAWQAFVSLLTALWEALKPYMSTAVGFGVGVKYQEGRDAKKALNDVDEAIAAANSVDSMSDADVLRYLQSVGAVRSVEGKPADDSTK